MSNELIIKIEANQTNGMMVSELNLDGLNITIDWGDSTAVAYGTSLTAGGGATERTSSNNTAANASQSHENMPPYLSVYMWKRTG